MNDAMRLSISQMFVNRQARIIDDEAIVSLISAYDIYMKNKIESGATDDEKKIMKNELAVLYETADICKKLRDWANG